MPLFQDLFVRDNFGDTGMEPVTDSYVSASPDIIPYGQSTLTAQQLIDTYSGPFLNQPLQNNQLSNIYVRSKNNYDGSTSGQISLYYATGNLLVNVSAWRGNRIPNNNGSFGANVSATQVSQIAPGDQPFSWTPDPSLGSHFCLIGLVSTAMNPNQPPSRDFLSWQGFVDWVRGHANVCWHNVDVVNTLPPQGYLNSLVFENINNVSQFYGFQCNYSGMPVGSILRLYSLSDPSQGYSGFDSGPQSINNGTGSLGQGAMFPPNFSTSIFTTCQFPGSPTKPPPGVAIQTVSLGYQTAMSKPENQKYASFSYPPDELGITLPSELEADGLFVQITAFNTLFSPTEDARIVRVAPQ